VLEVRVLSDTDDELPDELLEVLELEVNEVGTVSLSVSQALSHQGLPPSSNFNTPPSL
jgi:hypothetical protein